MPYQTETIITSSDIVETLIQAMVTLKEKQTNAIGPHDWTDYHITEKLQIGKTKGAKRGSLSIQISDNADNATIYRYLIRSNIVCRSKSATTPTTRLDSPKTLSIG